MNMNIHVMRIMEYKNANIYVFHYGNTSMFQYLFTYKNELRQHQVFLKPRWKDRLMWFFGKPLYPKDVLDPIEHVLITGAVDSIDQLIEENKLPRKKIPINK